MPTDTEKLKAIKELYDKGMAEVSSIVGSLDATPAEKKAAREMAKDLSSMRDALILDTIEARTALLSTLITDLNTVIDSIKTNSQLAEVLGRLNGVVTQAGKLFESEKASV